MTVNTRSRNHNKVKDDPIPRLKESINNIQLSNNTKAKSNFAIFQEVLIHSIKLIKIGDGHTFGDRAHHHISGKKREFSDPQVWTHIFFFIGSIYSLLKLNFELSFLLLATTILSTYYHYCYEKPGILTKLESLCAKIMFVYGFSQMFFAPNIQVFISEIFLCILTLMVFVFTNFNKAYYEPWHCFMHIIPAFWGIILAKYHSPFIDLNTSF